MVKVVVKLTERPETMELAEGACVSELIRKLSPRWRDNVLVVVDGKVARPDDPLRSSDRVVVLPLMSGG